MAKRSEILKTILAVIAAAGVITIAIVAPNIIGAFASQFKLYRQFGRKQVKRTFNAMEKSGLIEVRKEGEKTVIKLTKNGRSKLLKFKFDEMKIKSQKHWDKKWRLVIFDVPQNFHLNRTVFTRKLRELGLKQFQKSVWVTPYPCKDEIDFLKEVYFIRPFVRIVTAEAIDIENDLLKAFNLG